MAEIIVDGHKVLVDDDLYPYLSSFDWFVYDGYVIRRATVNGKAKLIRMQREVVGCEDPSLEVDHINGNRLDNRRCNLRVCTKSQNLANRTKKDPKATSKYKGVRYLKTHGYYQVRVTKDKVTYTIGHYTNELAAANMYNHAARTIHGEFYRPNDVMYMSVEECEKYRVKGGRKHGKAY